MSLEVFGAVILAAMLHASWNAIVTGSGDKLITTVSVTSCAGIIAAITLPFLPAPQVQSWPYVTASAVLQVVYFVLLARAYHATDFGLAYPLMRGTAPMLVALARAVVFGDKMSPIAWAGISMVGFGITGLTLSVCKRSSMKGVGLALVNAVVIASYSIIDGTGARLSGSPASYTLWLFLLTALPLAAWALVARRQAFTHYLANRPHLALVGGLGTVASYGIVLWAMTVAPIALVAALRETSILFATAIAVFTLKERVSPIRILIVCIVASGAILIRLV